MTALQWSLFILACLPFAKGANILGVMAVPGRSHNILFQRLMVSLANAGHNVTYYSAYKQPKPVPNLTEVILPMTSEQLLGASSQNLFNMRHQTPFESLFRMSSFGIVISEKQLESTEMQELLNSESQFDVVIGESFLTESINALLAHRFKASLIAFAPVQPILWCNYMVGNIAPSSYIPSPFLGFPQKMSFTERATSFVFDVVNEINHRMVYLPKQEKIYRRYAGEDAPSMNEITKNTSLVFSNDHFSLSYPRPLVPNLVSIGGVHVNPPKSLPEDLQKHLDGSKDGAILFSMGSNLKSSDMPPEKIKMFLDTFAKLKQNVLWKFETDLPGKPKNLLISNWLPQSDILAHPNIKLFITHGGLLSTTESVDRGVPIIGIPIFGDQPMNMKQSVNAGVGLSLNLDEITSETLLAAIREILDNPKYKEAAQLRSKLLHDQPQTPLETAIFWIEYVIRHKGAKHLRSAVQDLTWYQASQLDVVLTIVGALAAVLYFLKVIIAFILSKLCGAKINIQTDKKTK